MRSSKKKVETGFSLIELMITMTIMLIMMGLAGSLFSKSMSVRARESRTTDALTSAYAALNVMSREIGNGGFGLVNPATGLATNGIVLADSNATQIHIRSNFTNVVPYTDPNAPGQTNDPGEDITYYFEPTTKSIVRHNEYPTPSNSVIVNKISNVTFKYYDYVTSGSAGVDMGGTPSAATGRILITVTVDLDPVNGQPNPEAITFSSEVNMRNSNYMLQQY